jgi:hypothetical protein
MIRSVDKDDTKISLQPLDLFLYLGMKFNVSTSGLEGNLKETKQKSLSFSLIRILVFFGIAGVGIVGVTDNSLLLILLIPLVGLFIYLIIQNNFYSDQEAFIIQLMEMEKESSMRLRRDLKPLSSGEEFTDKNHPFSNDLDLFGEHSLFQLINHTVSKSGTALLAKWIKAPLDVKQAKARNPAILELAKDPDFLHHFEGIGRAFIKSEKSKHPFFSWLNTSVQWKKIFFLPLFLGPIGGITLLYLTSSGIIAYSWLGIWIVVGMGFLSLVFKQLRDVAYILPDQGDIKTYALWAGLLESKKWQNSYLDTLLERITSAGYSTTKSLKSLEQKSFLIQNRFNLMYLIFNMIFWLDFGVLWRLLKWKERYGSKMIQLETYFDEWQVLISLASFSNQEPVRCELLWTAGERLEASKIRHPLLRSDIAVPNDFTLNPPHRTVLLTGANMSGKTTFMRTIGINLVLANLGLQPFADRMNIGEFQLFTSMRNADNLGESVSSFYAELARIRQVLMAAESGKAIFFLMDEILKGTNTTDRILGSEALIRQLAAAKASGIISTHDIELATLENSLPYLVNMSFHSEIQDQEIKFDYIIKQGPCPSFNAHKLMELMGIRFGK